MSYFFFNDTAPTEIYTLSLHDALPIYGPRILDGQRRALRVDVERPLRLITVHFARDLRLAERSFVRSEEHTSELQSQSNLVCRLLLEKKKKPENTENNTRFDR